MCSQHKNQLDVCVWLLNLTWVSLNLYCICCPWLNARTSFTHRNHTYVLNIIFHIRISLASFFSLHSIYHEVYAKIYLNLIISIPLHTNELRGMRWSISTFKENNNIIELKSMFFSKLLAQVLWASQRRRKSRVGIRSFKIEK